MKSGIRPKCGANDIRLDEGRWSHRNWLAPGFTAWSGTLRLRNLVRASCGCLESYIRPKDLIREWMTEAVPYSVRASVASDECPVHDLHGQGVGIRRTLPDSTSYGIVPNPVSL